MRLANRGRLLLRTPGPVPFGTCICSDVETILSWACHVYGPFEFRTSLGTSVLLLNVCPFDYTAVAGNGKVWPVNQVNHTSWVAVVTPTDRPKSVRNRCVIELFVALFVLSLCPFDISVGVGAFVI